MLVPALPRNLPFSDSNLLHIQLFEFSPGLVILSPANITKSSERDYINITRLFCYKATYSICTQAGLAPHPECFQIIRRGRTDVVEGFLHEINGCFAILIESLSKV